jgi:hypothetical protein
VTAVVCLLLVFLVPVLLARPRERSIRLVCAANLSQISKTMFIYAADNEGALPQAGGLVSLWGPTPDWLAPSRQAAFGLWPDGRAGRATISSSFYLLTKYSQTPTRLFLCHTTARDFVARGDPRGIMPTVGSAVPHHRKDSILVHDPNPFPPLWEPVRR